MLVGIVGDSISLFILSYFHPLLLVAATGASLYWLSEAAWLLGSNRQPMTFDLARRLRRESD
jgi:hypothetical protein